MGSHHRECCGTPVDSVGKTHVLGVTVTGSEISNAEVTTALLEDLDRSPPRPGQVGASS